MVVHLLGGGCLKLLSVALPSCAAEDAEVQLERGFTSGLRHCKIVMLLEG